MTKRIMAASWVALSLLSFQTYAKSININPLMTGLNSSYLGLEDASLSDRAFSNKRTPGRMVFYSSYYWDREPWVLMSKDRQKEVEPIVSQMNVLDLGFSWLLSDDMQLGVQMFGASVEVAPKFGGENNFHSGDARVQFKYRFLTDVNWNMAIAPELTIPTGVEYVGHRYGASLSNSSFAPGFKFIGEYRTNQNQWTLNLGYTYYDQAEFKFPNLDYPKIDGRSRLSLGTGWLWRLSRQWALDTEYSSQMPTGPNYFTQPGLLTLGARFQAKKAVSWHFGAGSGSLGTPGGNDALVYFGIKVPLFGSQKSEKGPEMYEDPLLQEAYRKNLLNTADDPKKVSAKELEPYLNTNPVDTDTGQPLYTLDELTKKLNDEQKKKSSPGIESDRFQ